MRAAGNSLDNCRRDSGHSLDMYRRDTGGSLDIFKGDNKELIKCLKIQIHVRKYIKKKKENEE